MAKVQIEKTSKRLKLTLLLCRLSYVAAIFWGVCVHASAEVNGVEPSYVGPVVLFVVALAVSFVTRFLIWWCHG